mmetsp:Transcript_4899/g.7407  ORF Transcript_4899/g.7407 Transcript_4899/m.7407 type:complete len:257 (-) Transcript_4899:121-891(-)|eukprot:CAMPEP_0171453040 /NCGR_PEP_ID=MMETSP0945-20130129/908_1 /TAXON_ID=109269 /ORGANISM="Vaucheria litorea, Strain CCMP2940" /LENGTH=256 /DNA_ID=CAMNT_0011977829 /DNA_START=22 /DNA_END=792 /DNA_ORIENTATION=+
MSKPSDSNDKSPSASTDEKSDNPAPKTVTLEPEIPTETDTNTEAYKRAYYSRLQQFYIQQSYYQQQTESVGTDPTSQNADRNSVSKLNSILDSIKTDDTVIGGQSDSWTKLMDPLSGVPYYYNHSTNKTQWNCPEEYVDLESILGTDDPPADKPIEQNKQPESDPYLQQAQFNTTSGKYDGNSASDNHWVRTGKPLDRETRQLAHYFDITTLDQNRKEAKEKAKKIAKARVDWKSVNAEKKAKRFRLNNAWLFTPI